MPPVLYRSADLGAWKAACAGYCAALRAVSAAKKKDDLPELDRWFIRELPAEIAASSPPHVTRRQLSKVMRWKLAKGKWRPRLQQFVDEADEKAVKDASLRALAFLEARPAGDVDALRKALDALSKPLKGVGPATATAVLSAASPAVPFMSDEALEEVLGTRDYSVAEAVALAAALQAEARRLNQLEKHGGGSGGGGSSSSAAAAAAEVEADALLTAASTGAAEDTTLGSAVGHPVWTARRVELAIWSARNGGIELARAARGAGAGASLHGVDCGCAAADAAAAGAPALAAAASSSSTAAAASAADHPSPKARSAGASTAADAKPKSIRVSGDTANHQSRADMPARGRRGGSGSGSGGVGRAAPSSSSAGADADDEAAGGLASPSKRSRRQAPAAAASGSGAGDDTGGK